MQKKKKNLFLKIICFPLILIRDLIFLIIFGIVFLVGEIVFRMKTKNKQNVQKDDEARVFVSNHYDIFGPVVFFLKFPFRFRMWAMDKMMDPDMVEAQLGMNIYTNYKKVPKWIKFIFLKLFKSLVLFVLRLIGAIPVSRDNPRTNITTMQKSVKVLEKKKAIAIFPEATYMDEGVGDFFSGFASIAKFYYKKTKKCITFYPVFISRINKEMYIGTAVKYNPDQDDKFEQQRIADTLHDQMNALYTEKEVNGLNYQKFKAKQAKKNAKNTAIK